MASTIDSNMWYQMSYGNDTSSANQAFDTNTSGTGAILGKPLNSTINQNSFQWQFVHLNSSNPTYIVRSRYLGNQWFMGAFWQPLPSLPGMDTRIRTENYVNPDLVPKTAQWTIRTSDDGTGRFYLSTIANGTAYHVDSYQGVLYLKDANSAGSTNAMKWVLKSMTAINDQQWSYTPTVSATSTSSISSATSTLPASNSATATATATGVSTTQTSQHSSSSGSSISIGAIVGGVVGGLLLVLMIIAAIVFRYCRRRKQRATQQHYNVLPYLGDLREIEGRQLYGSSGGPFARSSPGLYEKDPSPLNYKHLPYQHCRHAAELPAHSHGSLTQTFSMPTRS